MANFKYQPGRNQAWRVAVANACSSDGSYAAELLKYRCGSIIIVISGTAGLQAGVS